MDIERNDEMVTADVPQDVEQWTTASIREADREALQNAFESAPAGFPTQTFSPVAAEKPSAFEDRPVKEEASGQNGAAGAYGYDMPQVSKAFTVVKKNCGSGLLLCGIILFGFSVIFRLVYPVMMQDILWTRFNDLLTRYGIWQFFSGKVNGFAVEQLVRSAGNWPILAVSLISAIPLFLYFVGLLLLFARARRHQGPADEAVGLGALRAGAVFSLVIWSFALIVYLGIAAYIAVYILKGYFIVMHWTLYLVAGAILLAFILILTYYGKIITSANRIQYVFETGEFPRRSLSLYVVTFNFLAVIASIGSTALMTEWVQYAALVVEIAAVTLINVAFMLCRRELLTARRSS
jgi:hypothetical protein